METNIQEALRAKDNAEKLFAVKDFSGARNYAVEAQALYPQLEGIVQMATTFEIFCAAERKFGGDIDFYAVLGLEPYADRSTIKKQYKKMAVYLHPDKNKTVGADGAFKLVSDAFSLLSDNTKRRSYDQRRNKQLSCGVVQTHMSSAPGAGVTGFGDCSKSVSSLNRLDTFWTVCTSCHVQYEYLLKYVNKRLSCKNCRDAFIAVEIGAAPITGSFPYSTWPYTTTDNGYGSQGYNGVSYVPTTSACFNGNGIPGRQSGHGSECVSNIPFQWSTYPVPSAGVVDHNGSTANSANVLRQSNGNVSRTKINVKHHMQSAAVDVGSNGHIGSSEPRLKKKLGRPPKKLKFDGHGATRNASEELTAFRTESDVKLSNGNIGYDSTSSTPLETLSKRCLIAPAFVARKLLIEKARTVIRQKLQEMELDSAAAAMDVKNEKSHEVGIAGELAYKEMGLTGFDHQSELKKAVSMPITVPDSDFHDFDKDKSEECFKPKQIWALYDEEDGMPRLYCLIRQIISVKPFKVFISYLSSKTDTEFGLVNWLDSGFTKSCGSFRAFNTDVIEQVNIFSHFLSREKAGRGGCVKIYPRCGDIWAVYRNWSTDWNRRTPAKVRHQYEMVEVLDDYSEELGVCITPLIKLDGFKTVYQRNKNKDAIRWIPRREMLRFSHQVPSCVLTEKATNLPDGCWDLDPGATPDELLQTVNKVKIENPLHTEIISATPVESLIEIQVEEEQVSHSINPASTPAEFLQNSNKVRVEKIATEVLQACSQVKVGETPIEIPKDLNDMQVGSMSPAVVENCAEVQQSKSRIEVLQDFNEVQVAKAPGESLQEFHKIQVDKAPVEVLQDFNEVQVHKTPTEVLQDFNEVQVHKTPVEVLQDFNDGQVHKTPIKVLQDFNEFQLDDTPFEVFHYFNDMQVDKTPLEVLRDFDEVQMERSPLEVLQDFNEVQMERTPHDVLRDFDEVEVENPHYMERCADSMDHFHPIAETQVNQRFPFPGHMSAATPSWLFEDLNREQVEKPRQMENHNELHPVMQQQ